MEILPLGGRIAAQIRIGRAESLPEIVDMPEQVSLRVLRAGTAEMTADAPIRGRAPLDRPVLDRHAAQQHKAAAVEHLRAQAIEHRSEPRQREVLAPDV